MIYTYKDALGIRHLVVGFAVWAKLRCTGSSVPAADVGRGRIVTCLRCVGARQR